MGFPKCGKVMHKQRTTHLIVCKWAPVQDFVIQGLENLGSHYSSIAKDVAQKWISSTYCAWLATNGSLTNNSTTDDNEYRGLLFEKYDVRRLGGIGDGKCTWVLWNFGRSLI
jgi:hypothetical protein